MVSWFFTRMPGQVNAERSLFSTHGGGTTEYPHIKELSWNATSHYIKINSKWNHRLTKYEN